MSTITVIVVAACSLVLGIWGTVSGSHKEVLKDTDGVPYLNPKTFGRDSKRGTRLLIASASLGLISTVISLIWK